MDLYLIGEFAENDFVFVTSFLIWVYCIIYMLSFNKTKTKTKMIVFSALRILIGISFGWSVFESLSGGCCGHFYADFSFANIIENTFFRIVEILIYTIIIIAITISYVCRHATDDKKQSNNKSVN